MDTTDIDDNSIPRKYPSLFIQRLASLRKAAPRQVMGPEHVIVSVDIIFVGVMPQVVAYLAIAVCRSEGW